MEASPRPASEFYLWKLHHTLLVNSNCGSFTTLCWWSLTVEIVNNVDNIPLSLYKGGGEEDSNICIKKIYIYI